MNQIEFLGHLNLYGNSVSMKDVQAAQTKFWTDVFLACVAKGENMAYATSYADYANERFKERFVP